jgi:hypothetical protein
LSFLPKPLRFQFTRNASCASGNRIRFAPDPFSTSAGEIQSAQGRISGEENDAPTSEHGFSVFESGISCCGFDFRCVSERIGGDQADPTQSTSDAELLLWRFEREAERPWRSGRVRSHRRGDCSAGAPGRRSPCAYGVPLRTWLCFSFVFGERRRCDVCVSSRRESASLVRVSASPGRLSTSPQQLSVGPQPSKAPRGQSGELL